MCNVHFDLGRQALLQVFFCAGPFHTSWWHAAGRVEIFTKLKTRDSTLGLGGESESFCTWRSRCVLVVRVHSMMYGVDDGDRCIVIAHTTCVWCISPHVQVRACEAAFDILCIHTCGNRPLPRLVIAFHKVHANIIPL